VNTRSSLDYSGSGARTIMMNDATITTTATGSSNKINSKTPSELPQKKENMTYITPDVDNEQC